MAKSARLDPRLQQDLERAARALGITQSELIRDAIKRRCREVLGETLAQQLAPEIGIVRGGGGLAHNTGEAFKRLLMEKHRRSRK